MRSGFRSASSSLNESRPSCASAVTTRDGRRPPRTNAAAPALNISNARRFILAGIERDGDAAAPSHRLLRHEYVAVQDRRDTEVRHIDQLRDVEIDGHAHQYVGLLATQPLRLDQIVNHVERSISRCQADVLREVGEASDFL